MVETGRLRVPKMIALDMDGTLLDSEGRISERNLAAMRMAEAAGVEVVIATGRRHSFAMRVLREAGLPEENAVVSSNGTVIRTMGAELMHRHHMPVESAKWLCEHASAFRSTMVVTFDNVGPDGEDSLGALVVESLEELQRHIGKWMESNGPWILEVPRLDEMLDGVETPPIQMMLCGTMEQMGAAEALLGRHPLVAGVGEEAGDGVEIVLHRTSYPEKDLSIVDILPVGCSKASALAWLAKQRGYGLEDVMAIGDNWNDVPMLAEAGRGVLMANAPAELLAMARERGWEMAPANDEDGVAVVMEQALTVGARC